MPLVVLCYSEENFPQMHIENGVFIILLTLTVTLDERQIMSRAQRSCWPFSSPLEFF